MDKTAQAELLKPHSARHLVVVGVIPQSDDRQPTNRRGAAERAAEMEPGRAAEMGLEKPGGWEAGLYTREK